MGQSNPAAQISVRVVRRNIWYASVAAPEDVITAPLLFRELGEHIAALSVDTWRGLVADIYLALALRSTTRVPVKAPGPHVAHHQALDVRFVCEARQMQSMRPRTQVASRASPEWPCYPATSPAAPSASPIGTAPVLQPPRLAPTRVRLRSPSR